MTPGRADAIQRRIREIITNFGKVAVLIDDAPDAASRVAREFYATEELPRWWLLAQSAECGAAALGVLVEVFKQPAGSSRICGLIVIDRFLPAHDEQGWATAWDAPKLGLSEEDRAIHEEMRQNVSHLIALSKQQGAGCLFSHVLITSYPHVSLEPASHKDVGDPLPWQRRSIEVLFRRRRKLPRSLLQFGPEKAWAGGGGSAPPTYRRFSRDHENAWKARVWRPTIEGLAKSLEQADPKVPKILFTGAGASLAQGAYGSGMPPTWWLLEEASRSLVHDPAESDVGTGQLEGRDSGAPPRDSWQCCHADDNDAERRPKREWSWDEGAAPIDWLVDYLLSSREHRASDLRLGLDMLFERESNQNGRRSMERFYQYFRSHLERFDHGFPYHYWLLAQMPWTRIITTNFDNFHERAAFAAASSLDSDPEVRHTHLPLGCVFPHTSSPLGDDAFERMALTHRLFKPYGNLLSPEEIVLGDTRESATQNGAPFAFVDRLRQSFRGLENARDGWLVVVGHSMKDRYISDALAELSALNSFKLLWIIPDAVRRCAPRVEDRPSRPRWEGWMFERLNGRESEAGRGEHGQITGPLPGTALEFAYDLWREYQHRVEAKAGRL